MKRSIFALGLALSLAFTACQKHDTPAPSSHSGSKQSAGPAKPRGQLPELETLRLHDNIARMLDCEPHEEPQHAQPSPVPDTGLISGPRTSLPGNGHGTAVRTDEGEQRAQRFPGEATK
jgi:hypothetical protein